MQFDQQIELRLRCMSISLSHALLNNGDLLRGACVSYLYIHYESACHKQTVDWLGPRHDSLVLKRRSIALQNTLREPCSSHLPVCSTACIAAAFLVDVTWTAGV